MPPGVIRPDHQGQRPCKHVRPRPAVPPQAPPLTFAAQLPETLETQLFDPGELPWEELAFSSVSLALRFYLEDREAGTWTQHHGVIQKAVGAGPNDPGGFQLVDHYVFPAGGAPTGGAERPGLAKRPVVDQS